MFKTKLSILTQLALLGSSAFAMDSGSCPFSKADVLRGFYGDGLAQTHFENVLSNKSVEIGGSQYKISVESSPESPYPTLANLRSTVLTDIVFGNVLRSNWSNDSLNFFEIKCSGTGVSRTLTFTLNEYYRGEDGKDIFQRLLAKSGIGTALHIGWPELNFEFTLTGTWPGSTSSSSSGSSGYGYGYGYGSYYGSGGPSSSSSSYQQQQEEAARKAKEEAARKAQEEAARKAQEDAYRKAQEEAARKASSSSSYGGSKPSSSGPGGYGYGSSSSSSGGYYGGSSSYYGGSNPSSSGTGGYGYGPSSSGSGSYSSPKPEPKYEQPQNNPQESAQPKVGDVRTENGKKERWNGSRWVRM